MSDLSENQFLIDHIYLHSPIGIALLSAESGLFLRVNPAFGHLLGYTPSELVGTAESLLCVTPDDPSAPILALAPSLREGPAAVSIEKQYIGKEGNSLWVALQVALIQTGTDTPCLLLQATDISERKLAELASLKSSDLNIDLDLLFSHNVQDVITYSKPDGTILYCSPTIKTLMGYAPYEMIGKNRKAFYHPDDAVQMEQPEQLYSDSKVFTRRLRHKDGHYFWLETAHQVVLNEKGEPDKILTIGRNVDEKKRYQDTLAEAQRIAQMGSWDWNSATSIINFSEEIRKIFGYAIKPVEYNFDSFIACVHPDDLAGFEEAFKQDTADTSSDGEYIYRIVLPDSTVKVIHGLWTIMKNEDGQNTQIIGMAQDITERRLMEERLEESERNHRLISENSQDFIARLSVDGTLTYK